MAQQINFLDRVISWWSPDAGLRRRRARAQLTRAYEGAARTDGWRPRRAGASANADHAADASELRSRARALVQNVPYIARGVQALVSATIGTGLEPRFDGADADRLNALWADWEKVADADAIFDLYGLQAAAYRAMVQDGEVLIRRRTRRPTDGLPVPLQLQLLEIDWLDSSKNSTSRTSNPIINGIEYDTLGKPAAYWLFEQHPGDSRGWLSRTGKSNRVPAADIIHLFAPSRPGQGRGVTRIASIIARTRDLSLYEDAELQRKNLETRLGVVVSGDASALENGITAYGSAAAADDQSSERRYGDLGILPSGGITEVPPGLQMTGVEPKPAGGYVEYCKFNLHLIAAGLGVPYESLTGDMVEVNFSSARIRQIDFRRDIEQEQWLVVIPRLCDRIAAWFVDAASLIGKAGNGKRTIDWSTPRWDYVNPAQDVDADLAAMSGGLLSPSEALRRRGYKPEQVFSEIGKDFERLKAVGALDFMQFLMDKGGVASSLSRSTAADDTDDKTKNKMRDAVEAVQKVYLGVGKVITSDEARDLINQTSGAALAVPGPNFGETT